MSTVEYMYLQLVQVNYYGFTTNLQAVSANIHLRQQATPEGQSSYLSGFLLNFSIYHMSGFKNFRS